jgi:hypothetical protein
MSNEYVYSDDDDDVYYDDDDYWLFKNSI